MHSTAQDEAEDKCRVCQPGYLLRQAAPSEAEKEAEKQKAGLRTTDGSTCWSDCFISRLSGFGGERCQSSQGR